MLAFLAAMAWGADPPPEPEPETPAVEVDHGELIDDLREALEEAAEAKRQNENPFVMLPGITEEQVRAYLEAETPAEQRVVLQAAADARLLATMCPPTVTTEECERRQLQSGFGPDVKRLRAELDESYRATMAALYRCQDEQRRRPWKGCRTQAAAAQAFAVEHPEYAGRLP